MLKVYTVPIFSDNYVWILQSDTSNEVCVIDPGDAAPIIAYLKQNDLKLTQIMITHSHSDHIGGIDGLLDHAQVPVLGPDCKAIPQVSEILSEGDSFQLWGATVKVMHLPGHLPELLAYAVSHEQSTQVFSGDILFSSGCGRIFDGTHFELKTSLDRIKALPKDTLIYGAHEYTASNLSFAQAVEPDSQHLTDRTKVVTQLRVEDKPTLPALLSTELEVNPFLRCDQTSVIAAAKRLLKREPTSELEVFTQLRLWKDRF